MFARVHIEEEIGQGALEAGAAAFVDRETRAGDFGAGFEIEDSGALADFPVGLWLKIEFRWRAPTADFLVIRGTGAYGNGRVWHVGDSEKNFALAGIEPGDALVGLFNAFRNLFHFRDQPVRVLFLLFQARNFVAGLVALSFQLLGSGDELAAFLVEGAESV